MLKSQGLISDSQEKSSTEEEDDNDDADSFEKVEEDLEEDSASDVE